jgi:hypothetical protein
VSILDDLLFDYIMLRSHATAFGEEAFQGPVQFQPKLENGKGIFTLDN